MQRKPTPFTGGRMSLESQSLSRQARRAGISFINMKSSYYLIFMETICISLGGHVVFRKNGVNVIYIKKLLKLIKDYVGVYKFIIVVGGGYASRLYTQPAREIIKNNEVLDEIAIAITRINAMIVKDILSELNVYPNVATSLDELRAATKSSEIVLMGGLLPGMTTDAVAVLASEVVNGKVMINIGNGSYVYDRPPSQKGAKKLEKLDHNRLVEIASRYDTREADATFIFDLVASKLAKRANMEIRFVNDDIDQLRLAMINERHSGSIVRD
jgi:uridylate kinase